MDGSYIVSIKVILVACNIDKEGKRRLLSGSDPENDQGVEDGDEHWKRTNRNTARSMEPESIPLVDKTRS